MNDSYNNYMSMVDQADQLRGYYQPDRFLRQNKWWWSFYFWGHGTLFVNAYCLYRAFMKCKNRKILPHYEFCRRIILAKIDPKTHLPMQVSSPSTVTKFVAKSTRKRETSTRTRRQNEMAEPAVAVTRAKKLKEDNFSKKSVYVTDKSLSPHGTLNIRLSRQVPHMLDPVTRDAVKGRSCQLCRWASGTKNKSHLVKCDDCNVICCVWCWRPFHEVEDLEEIKEDLAAACFERKPAVAVAEIVD